MNTRRDSVATCVGLALLLCSSVVAAQRNGRAPGAVVLAASDTSASSGGAGGVTTGAGGSSVASGAGTSSAFLELRVEVGILAEPGERVALLLGDQSLGPVMAVDGGIVPASGQLTLRYAAPVGDDGMHAGLTFYLGSSSALPTVQPIRFPSDGSLEPMAESNCWSSTGCQNLLVGTVCWNMYVCVVKTDSTDYQFHNADIWWVWH